MVRMNHVLKLSFIKTSLNIIFKGKNGNADEIRMFNCDHCQKKYKRSWHQARHSQMKHENSNASTTTTSSAGTPPTPEINGNIPNNSNYNYQQLQQVPQMPLQQDLHQLTTTHVHSNQHQNAIIPPVSSQTWDNVSQSQHSQVHQPVYDAVNSKSYNIEQPSEVTTNGDYVNYAVNEQFSNKFEQVHAPPPGAIAQLPVNYESWVSISIVRVKRKGNLNFITFLFPYVFRILNRQSLLGTTIIILICNHNQ